MNNKEEPLDPTLKVLVVDDFTPMRRLVKNALRALKLTNMVEAKDGKEAVAVLESKPVDLIVSDWNMPNMTGIELLIWVRTQDKFKDLPFIMLTAEGQKENVVEAIKQGVSNYLVKPFTEEMLENKIRAVLNRQAEG